MKNRFLKYGLALQIPNATILAIILIYWMIYNINWSLIAGNFVVILLGAIFALINIFSIIFIALGIFGGSKEIKE